jgi:uncharacterized GH25 family protein
MRIAAVLVLIVAAGTANAHFHMLMPDRHSIKTDETVTLTYQFGHPFEHELFDTDKPEKARVFAPDGTETNLLSKLERVEMPGKDDKKVTVYRVKFAPTARGDYTFVFDSPAVWMEEGKHFLRDSVRVIVHVQTQNGWDHICTGETDFGLVAMTRPYGLRPGTVYQARVIEGGSHRVEVERYNPEPPKELPPDELITLALRTDKSGLATCTLPDPGWWVICATRSPMAMTLPPKKERDGKPYPVVERAILWVFVDDVKAK